MLAIYDNTHAAISVVFVTLTNSKAIGRLLKFWERVLSDVVKNK